jgi:predicted nucleotidyltransferase
MLIAHNWKPCVPKQIRPLLETAPLHSIAAGERAILARLRTMTDAEFEALPYGSEGLWRKFMHACRKEATLEAIIAATKSKRYTRTRLDRMVMCAFLGITGEMMTSPSPYVRVLALNDAGRKILRQKKDNFWVINAGERPDHPYWELEKRCGDLYGLFSAHSPEPPCPEENRRVVYVR